MEFSSKTYNTGFIISEGFACTIAFIVNLYNNMVVIMGERLWP
jgi:hypothetical protein